MQIKKVIENHLNAIKKRDLQSYTETISQNNVKVILLNGSIIEGRDSVIELHQNWFKDPDWKIDFNIKSIDKFSSCVICIVEVLYSDIDMKGTPINMKYLLSLTFEENEGSWKLIFDQNTNIKT